MTLIVRSIEAVFCKKLIRFWFFLSLTDGDERNEKNGIRFMDYNRIKSSDGQQDVLSFMSLHLGLSFYLRYCSIY